jgi:hypothetical protein
MVRRNPAEHEGWSVSMSLWIFARPYLETVRPYALTTHQLAHLSPLLYDEKHSSSGSTKPIDRGTTQGSVLFRKTSQDT